MSPHDDERNTNRGGPPRSKSDPGPSTESTENYLEEEEKEIQALWVKIQTWLTELRAVGDYTLPRSRCTTAAEWSPEDLERRRFSITLTREINPIITATQNTLDSVEVVDVEGFKNKMNAEERREVLERLERDMEQIIAVLNVIVQQMQLEVAGAGGGGERGDKH